MTEARVRIRGIYATALTQRLLASDVAVVQPSAAIADRFDREFSWASATVRITSTTDEEGIQLTGAPDAVEAVADRLDGIGDGVWSWPARLPHLGVYVGRVVETSDHGAIVRTGSGRAGFLPFSQARGYVDTDDLVVVQVTDPYAPWAIGRRPVLTQELFVADEVATLGEDVDGVNGGNASLNAALDRLSIDLPADWGIRWHDAASEMALTTIQAALSEAVARAQEVQASRAAVADPAEPAVLSEPVATHWYWFDREARFDLDDHREAVTETMAGHHRIKAGGGPAGAAVDFVEALPGSPPEFDADAAISAFGPSVDDRVQIRHGKPDGTAFELGPGEVVERADGGEIVVEREMTAGGTYDALGTEQAAGDRAISTFVEGRWWYPTVYRSAADERKGTYVNVGTPIEIFPDRVRYLDLHVDVVKRPDGTVERVDEEELDDAVAAGRVPADIAARARQVAASIENAF